LIGKIILSQLQLQDKDENIDPIKGVRGKHMRHALYITTLFIFGLFLTSCKQTLPQAEDNYPKDTLISDFQGKPNNSLTIYLPYFIKIKETIIHTSIDTMMNEYFSYSLYKFNEPVLSNYYLGQDMYRFLWLRSFHRPVIITLTKNNDSVKLITKEFDGRTHYFESRHCLNCDTSNLDDPKLMLNETTELTMKEWEEFESLLIQSNFWNIVPFEKNIGNDGAEWAIEAHLKDKYWFVSRWSPKDRFTDCGKYLIKLSGLKEEIY